MAEKKDKEEGKVQIYELGYHLAPTVSEADLVEMVLKIKALIEEASGKIISEEVPTLGNLAYDISKFDKSYFGWLKFEMDASHALAFKKAIQNFSEVIRFILVKTVRENTIYQPKVQRPRREEGDSDMPADLPVETKEVSEEEIDKSIEQLVIA